MDRRHLTPALGVGVLCLALVPGAAQAEKFTAACSGTTGDPASLVTAFESANALSGDDTVELGQGCTYTFTVPHNNWYGPNGLPAIASGITVEGHGATIYRPPGLAFRFFFVGADATSAATDSYVSPGPGRLTLRNLTLEGGLAQGGSSQSGGGGAGLGGAIFNHGTLVVEGSALINNGAYGGRSGCQGFCILLGAGGGGIGRDATTNDGGGFGPGNFGGGAGGDGVSGLGGGGAGFRNGENGNATVPGQPGAGGGPNTGLGGRGGGNSGGAAGDGSGGAASGTAGGAGDGGDFGEGGEGGDPGGGGGVGGGGGAGSPGYGGGGGFGAGGGDGRGGGEPTAGGFGGFGGGGGPALGGGGLGGFGGASADTENGGGGAGMGGAIFNMQGGVTIRNSTIANNSAVAGPDNAPDNAKGLGGAVFNLSGSVEAVGSTLAANTAGDGGAGVYSLIYDSVTGRAAQVTLRDTVVAANLGPEDLVSDKPATTVVNPNLGTASAGVAEFDHVRVMVARGAGTISGTPLSGDPQLGPLEDNGGPSRTMAPMTGSPLIDAGSAFGLTTDQRGVARPSDFFALPDAGDGSDIGAVELQSPDKPPAGPGPGPGPGLGPGPGPGPRSTRCAGKPATIVGTGGPDRLRGTKRRDVIAALGGNDRVRGLGGNDLVCGGKGKDTLRGGRGKDVLRGDVGNDRLLGDAGKDRLLGGAGRDKLVGGPGRDKLLGGPGRDSQRQ